MQRTTPFSTPAIRRGTGRGSASRVGAANSGRSDLPGADLLAWTWSAQWRWIHSRAMDQTDAASFVTGRVRVERADVAAAKSFIAARFAELANRERDPRAGTVRAETLIQAWIGECDIDAPWSKALYRGWLERETHLDLTGPDAEAQLTTCARAISQAVAVQEALRELAASGLLIAIGPTVPWHEVAILAQSHGGRHRFGLTITDLSSAYPERVMVPWARRGKSSTPARRGSVSPRRWVRRTSRRHRRCAA